MVSLASARRHTVGRRRRVCMAISVLCMGGSLLCLLCLLPACGASDASQNKAAVYLRGAGATFPKLIYQKWIETYEREHPAIDIEYEAVGSGDGVKRYLTNEPGLTFGASDVAPNPNQLDMVQRGAVPIPMTAGSIVLAYNLPGFDGELRLSRNVMAGIFLGTISQWNDEQIKASNPGKSLPDRAITVAVRMDGSGTTSVFTEHLAAISPAWRDGPGIGKRIDWPSRTLPGRGNAGVAARIQRSPGSIGYIQYGFAQKLSLPLATLENKAGSYIAPSGTSGTAMIASLKLDKYLCGSNPDPDGKDAYPIGSLTWILAYGRYTDTAESKALRDFLSWCLSEGQSYAEGQGYLQLPDHVRKRALQAVGTIQP